MRIEGSCSAGLRRGLPETCGFLFVDGKRWQHPDPILSQLPTRGVCGETRGFFRRDTLADGSSYRLLLK